MFGKSQDQTAAENAVALQVGGAADSVSVNQTNNTQNVGTQTNNYGVTIEQVRSIVSDAFKAEFYRFLDHAGDIATARAQKLCDAVLARLEKDNPAALNQANNPDFRYSLLTAQKAYARNDDENTGALLVELLVERSREEDQNLAQVILNEALEIVPRLTREQLAALTISFILKCTANYNVQSLPTFFDMLDKLVAPFVEKGKLSSASFSHLAFTGCGQIERLSALDLTNVFLQSYPGIWQAGFRPDDPILKQLSPETRLVVLRPSNHSAGMLEVFDAGGPKGKIVREQMIRNVADKAVVEQLLTRRQLSPDEIKKTCLAARPYMKALYDLWDTTDMKNFNISSVGMAIAHANIVRDIPNFGSLSIWVN
jgi:hypothetical protein